MKWFARIYAYLLFNYNYCREWQSSIWCLVYNIFIVTNLYKDSMKKIFSSLRLEKIKPWKDNHD